MELEIRSCFCSAFYIFVVLTLHGLQDSSHRCCFYPKNLGISEFPQFAYFHRFFLLDIFGPAFIFLRYFTYVRRRGFVNFSPSQVRTRFCTSRDVFASRSNFACISNWSSSGFPSFSLFSNCRNRSAHWL